MTDATEVIPADAISLVDAYQIVFDAMTPNSSKLLKAIRSPSAEANRKAWAAYDSARLKANVWLRQQIADKLLIPLIRDSNGDVLKLPHIGWEDPGFLDSGIDKNFVGPDDFFNPGPSTVLHEQRRPVFFNCKRDAFERLVREKPGHGVGPPRLGSVGTPSWKRDLEAYMEAIASGGRVKVIEMLVSDGYRIEEGRPSQPVMARAVRKGFLEKKKTEAKPEDVATVHTIIRDYKPRLSTLFETGFPTEIKK